MVDNSDRCAAPTQVLTHEPNTESRKIFRGPHLDSLVALDRDRDHVSSLPDQLVVNRTDEQLVALIRPPRHHLAGGGDKVASLPKIIEAGRGGGADDLFFRRAQNTAIAVNFRIAVHGRLRRVSDQRAVSTAFTGLPEKSGRG